MRLSQEVDAVLRKPALAQRLHELGAIPQGGGPQRLARFQQEEQAKWGQVI